MKILVIIPAFNESDNIETVISNIENCGFDVDYLLSLIHISEPTRRS